MYQDSVKNNVGTMVESTVNREVEKDKHPWMPKRAWGYILGGSSESGLLSLVVDVNEWRTKLTRSFPDWEPFVGPLIIAALFGGLLFLLTWMVCHWRERTEEKLSRANLESKKGVEWLFKWSNGEFESDKEDYYVNLSKAKFTCETLMKLKCLPSRKDDWWLKREELSAELAYLKAQIELREFRSALSPFVKPESGSGWIRRIRTKSG